MASKTERQRVLTGGMQLLPPGDKLDIGNSLICENFRVDQKDELRTRLGSVKEAGPVGSGTFHTLKRTANARYGGIGTSLYGGTQLQTTLATGLDGEPLGLAFYRGNGWLMNRAKQLRLFGGDTPVKWGVPAPTTAPTATGGGQLTTLIDEYDGAQAGLNVGLVSAPATADAAGVVSSGPNVFTEYAMQDGVEVVNDRCHAYFDSTVYRSGSASLQLVIAGADSVTAFIQSGLDLSVDGQTQDTDLIRVWFFASDPSKVERITVYVRTGTQTSAGHGYAEYTFLDPSKFLNQALNSWTQLKIARRLNLDDWSQRIADAATSGNQQTVSDVESQFATAIQTPTFIYTGHGWPQTGIGAPQPSTYPPSEEMLLVNWSAISEFGVSVKTSDAVQIGIDRAEVAGTVGENSSGAVQYFISFENDNSEDGNPGPASNAVIAGTQTITLTNIPVSAEPNIRARRIWRIGGGLSQAYLVDKLFGNSSTGPWVDNTSNAQAQADNVVMPVDHDLPPPCSGVIGPVFGKLIAFSSDLHPARMWWTRAAQPWFFPGALDEFSGNWEDVGQDDDKLLQATDHKQSVWMYKRRSIWKLGGDPDTTDVVKTNSNVGLVAVNAVVNGGAVDYFVGWEGVYQFNGDFETKISGAIDPIFKGDYVQLSDGEYLPPISFSNIKNCAIALVGDRLRVSYPEQGETLPNIVAICHIPTGRWMRERYNNLAAPAFTVLNYEGPGFFQMAGATGNGAGYLYQLEAGGFYLDDGQSAKAIWQSRFYDQDLPDNYKIYTDVEIDLQTGSGQSPLSSVTVYLVIDNGTKISLGTLTSSNGYDKPRFTGILRAMSADGNDVGRKGKNAAIRIESNFTGPIVIYGVYLHWYPEERVARSFDTGPTHFGIPERVKEVDYAEFYMTGSGQQLRKVVSSDLPGSLLVHRDDGNITAPNGRGNVRFRLGTPVDGRNFRLWLGDNPSGSTFQVHQARARMRPIGEYIDGTIGEYFESPEFSIAPGRVGELKDFLLDYDCTGGAGQFVLFADLPGNQIAEVRRISLPAQTRAPRVLPLEIPTLAAAGGGATALPYGQMFKVRLYPPPGGILRLHGRAVFRARVIGLYFDGTRGEIWETQPLDLMGGMAIFREISIISQSEGAMYLEMRTELPKQDMRTIANFTVNPSSSTSGRLPFIGRLPGNCKGRLQQFRLVGPHVARIFEVKVLGRLTQLNDSPWNWLTVPVEVTPDAWAEIKMPVRSTPEEFTWIDIPVDPIEAA